MSKFLASTVLFCTLIHPICSIVQLESTSSSFSDSPARFTRGLDGRICGNLQVADPLDACSLLLNKAEHSGGGRANIVLIVRGNCAFDEKVRNAQKAGFRAAIVYDDRPNHNLVSMMGSPDGLRIYAVFVSNKVGKILRENARSECCIISYVDGNGWTVLVISFMSVLAVISLLATILFTVNQLRNPRETGNVLDGKNVDKLSTITFGSVNVNGHVGETCAICLEDFIHEECLKVLPCQHVFHATCVSSWLTKWATFCPVCKHDLRSKIESSIK